MIVSKQNIDGVDVVIDGLQNSIHAKLLNFWQTGVVYKCYPRANKNYKKGSLIPEISLNEKEYSGDVFFDDKVGVSSFFLVSDSSTSDEKFKQITRNVSIIFQSDLVKLYGANERYDEQFNTDVLRVLYKEPRFICSDINITEGIDKVYSELNLSGDYKELIQNSDLSNRHIVRFSFDVVYRLKCINN
jgi:hypothetical protein